MVASHKASFNQPPSHSLSRWAVLIKTTAMAGILLVGAHGKHHKIIKSKVTLYPHWMSTSLRNKNPPVWCQWRRYGRTLVGWSNGDGEALALQDEWAASSVAAQTQVFFCLFFFAAILVQMWGLNFYETCICTHRHQKFSPHYHVVGVGRGAAWFWTSLLGCWCMGSCPQADTKNIAGPGGNIRLNTWCFWLNKKG